MKTDDTGGPSAESNVEERLSRRFAVELERAERDYPALMRSPRDPVRSTSVWRRIAVPMTGVVVLVAVSLVGVGLALRPGSGPAGSNDPAVVRGSDGIPTAIDGQRVYRIADQSEWQNLSGTFLLAAVAPSGAPSCPGSETRRTGAEADLLGCAPVTLSETPSGYGIITASKGIPLSAIYGWGGDVVVVRVHTHDPEAAQCGAGQKAACEAALVVEAVVWPTVPTKINGELVYRATDQASFPTSGSFLLGGPATKPSVVPPCPAPIDRTAAEQQLIQYCYILTVDGIGVAPMSAFDEPNGEIVVARVHINDPLAAQCPADVRSQCQSSVVVESVVWRSTEDAASATPTSAASTTTPSNPASGEGVGPGPSASVASGPSAGSAEGSAGIGTSIGPLDSDGVPTSVARVPVYRGTTMPVDSTFLLGGPLTHDTGCAPTTAAAPPSCGYWMIDGVKVGTQVALPELPTGGLVVARLQRSKVEIDCAKPPCAPIEILVVTELVWSGPAVVAPPPPMLPGPSAS